MAEYGSFTVAAEKLHMTQPFISKSIASLESWLGLYLFVRGNRKFQITPRRSAAVSGVEVYDARF